MPLGRIRRCLAGAVLAAALVPVHEVAAHGVSLDIHHALAADSALQRGFLIPWTEKVEQESGGRIRFHLHPASTLGGSAAGLYEQVQEGGADVVWTPIDADAEHFPRLAVTAWPFTVRRAQGASRAVSEYVRVNDLAERDFDGVRLLAAHVGDGSQLHWGKTVTEPPADMKGRRVAAITPGDRALLAAMGATPVAMPLSQVAEALNAGSLDGVLLSWERAGALGIDRAARSHTEFGPGNAGLTSSLFVFAMHPGSYKSLSDDLKAVMNTNSGIETAAWLGRVLDDAAAGVRKAAAARGAVIRVMTPEERDRWVAAARTVTDATTQALEQVGVRVRPLQDSAREQLQQFDPPR